MDRRGFLGWVVLVGVPAVAACAGTNSGGSSGGSCDGRGTNTSQTAGHFHFVCVPMADLASPPAGGATYTTTTVSGHNHTVTFSAAQLTSIASGQSVTAETSSSNGHTHNVTFTAGSNVQPSPGGY